MTDPGGGIAHNHDEWVVLYALGSLSAAESGALQKHLDSGCEVCSECLRAMTETAGELGLAADPVAPDPELRERLLARARSQSPAGFPLPPERKGVLLDRDGVLVATSSGMDWSEGPLPGIWLKRLFEDDARERYTALVKMGPGVRYPSHRHAAAEELFLLDGELIVEGLRMVPGDYCRGEPGSVHGEVYSETGAIFIVMASKRDELLA